MREVQFDGTFDGWRAAARAELLQGTRPEEVLWRAGTDGQEPLPLFAQAADAQPAEPVGFSVPAAFLELASVVARHASGEQWPLLYRMLWLLRNGQPKLLENPAHADVLAAMRLEKEILKDAYRVVQFVRFREVTTDAGPWYVAWIEPEHDSLELATPHFVRRYASMSWSILTPRQCAHWDRTELSYTPGVGREAAPEGDDTEKLWLTYYSRVFNPARVKLKAMQAQMPRKTWQNLPETRTIIPALAEAPRRVAEMLQASQAKSGNFHRPAVAPVPPSRDLGVLRDAVSLCRACSLYMRASCAVFGEGKPQAAVMLVGEQPGDVEDRSGKPFVGPAGQVLDRALAQASVRRSQLYVTNAVKHFKWLERGKRRMHDTPNPREVAACKPWLEAELEAVKPKLVVCLGGTAALAVLGRKVKVLNERGRLLRQNGFQALVTIHPSMLLRLPSDADREAGFAAFVRDLELVRPFLTDAD